MTNEDRVKIAREYRKFLSGMKRKGLKVEDVPEEILPGMLALHQNALVVEAQKRDARKKARKST